MQDNTTLKIKVCGEDSPELAKSLAAAAQSRMEDKGYNENDIKYINNLKLKLIDGSLNINEKDLERFRVLCKLWDVELKPSPITSHRPMIGKLIVAVKKMVFPVIRVLLKDSFKQQRDFNAAAVSMLAEILNRQNKSENQKVN